MALLRGLKRGNVREFDAEYQLGFTDIWASELDTDLDTLYNSWNAVISGVDATIISDTPPPNPHVGQLWWRDQPDGALYIYYDDGNSTQWVAATPPVATKPDANQQLYDYTWKAGAVTVGTISSGQAGQQDSTTLLVHHLDAHGTDQTFYLTNLMIGSYVTIMMGTVKTVTGTISAVPTAAPVIALKTLGLTGSPPTDGSVVEVIFALPGDPCSEWIEVQGTLFPRNVYGNAASTGLGLALPNYNKPWAGQTISFGDPTQGNCTSIVGTSGSIELEVADQTAFLQLLSNTQTGGPPPTSAQALLQLASSQYADVMIGNIKALHITSNNVACNGSVAVGAAPTTPAAGMIQFASGRFQGYNGTAWQNLDVQQIGTQLWGGGKSSGWPYLMPLDATTTNVWIGGQAGARYYGFANGSGAGITTNYDSDSDKLDSISYAGWELDLGQVNSFQFLYYPPGYVHGQYPTPLMRVNSTGTVTVTQDPANALDLTTKRYVDGRISPGAPALVYIGATAPAGPTVGQLWWRTAPDQTLFIYFNDGTSSQWVPAVALTTNVITTVVSFIYPGMPWAPVPYTGGPFTFGQDFTVTVPGVIMQGVRFYKLSGDTPATRTATVWNQGTQAQIATATFTSESPTGWQQVSFSSPPTLTSGTTYRVGVNGTGSAGYVSGWTTVPTIGTGASMSTNGYTSTTVVAFPTTQVLSTWFGIDVMLVMP